jgi:histidine triad (HIT) family protein
VSLELPVDDPCSFCEYLAGRRAYTVLARGELVSVLVTREQRGRVHVLVIPTAHRPTVLDLVPAEHGPLMSAVARAARAVAAASGADGVAVWQKNGVADGQTIPHVHFHVAGTLPKGGTAWGPVPSLSVEETDEIADGLRPHWEAAADGDT